MPIGMSALSNRQKRRAHPAYHKSEVICCSSSKLLSVHICSNIGDKAVLDYYVGSEDFSNGSYGVVCVIQNVECVRNSQDRHIKRNCRCYLLGYDKQFCQNADAAAPSTHCLTTAAHEYLATSILTSS